MPAGYTVERSLDGAADWASVGSTQTGTTQLIDTSAAARTKYFYRVLATHARGGTCTERRGFRNDAATATCFDR